MLVLTTQATVFATSCFVVARERSSACLVLDPGAGSAEAVARFVADHDLHPVAVVATHGHPDHLWDAAAVTARWTVPFLLAEPDLDRLTDPAGVLGPGMSEGFAAMTGTPWRRPRTVQPLQPGRLGAAGGDLGLDVRLVPAPGHTPGSVLLVIEGEVSQESVLPPASDPHLFRTEDAGPGGTTRTLVFTGDVLFAGSIGRVDLPGGDGPTMLRTLRQLRSSLPPRAWLLPGHGAMTTMAAELTDNPYLDDRWLASGAL